MGNEEKLKLLFVCTMNMIRSTTAQVIYDNDIRFEVKSAGMSKYANSLLSEDIINWADIIIVMERRHSNYIRKHFSNICKHRKIVCLNIPDDYVYMQLALIEIVKKKVEKVYKQNLSEKLGKY